jgi:hypothetical protein
MYTVKHWRINSIAFYLGVVLLTPCVIATHLYAQSFPATVSIVSPEENGVVDTIGNVYQKEMKLTLDQQGDLTDFERVHYECGEVDQGNAADTTFDVQNKSGVIPVDLYLVAPTSDHNAPFECCVYLADFDHTPLSETSCVTFSLHTAGVMVTSPREQDEFTGNEVAVNFTRVGIEAASVRVTVDDKESEVSPDRFGVVTLPVLSNGVHTLVVQALTREDTEVGLARVINFQVSSALTPENVDQAEKFVKRARKTRSLRKRKRFLKNLIELLTDMSNGGTSNPDHPKLTAEKINTALRHAQKAKKRKKNRKKLKQYLKLTLEALVQTTGESADTAFKGSGL